MNNVIKFPPPAATAISEASVNGPYRPQPQQVPAQVPGWRNSDYPLAPVPLPRARPLPPERPVVAEMPQDQISTVPAWRRLIAGVGALLSSVGAVGGIIAMVAVGPIGLAIGAGAFVLGGAIIWLATKQ